MSTSRKPNRSSWSRIISTPTPPHRSTKPFPPPRLGAWSNASNGITRRNTAPGWTWPNPNSASSPRNVSTGASPTNKQSPMRSPPGSVTETKLTPSQSGTSQPTTPASNLRACTLRYDRIAPLERSPSELNRGRDSRISFDLLEDCRRAKEAAGMALSDDLRERVVGAVVEGGMSRNAAAKRFGVSIASAVRWVARFKAKGEISPAPTGGDRRSGRIEAHRDYLLGLIGRRPDMTLLEIQERLIANCGERFSSSVLWRFFDRHEMTLKKSLRMPRSSNTRMF